LKARRSFCFDMPPEGREIDNEKRIINNRPRIKEPNYAWEGFPKERFCVTRIRIF
jgi:hypothetical protein